MTDDFYNLPDVEITDAEERIFDDAESLILCLHSLEIRVSPEDLEASMNHLEVTPAQLPALMDFASRLGILLQQQDGERSPMPTPRMLGAMLLTRAEVCGARIHDREKQVVRFRFGLEDGTLHSLDETAQRFGISRERVQWIERRLFQRCCRAARRERSRKAFLAEL